VWTINVRSTAPSSSSALVRSPRLVEKRSAHFLKIDSIVLRLCVEPATWLVAPGTKACCPRVTDRPEREAKQAINRDNGRPRWLTGRPGEALPFSPLRVNRVGLTMRRSLPFFRYEQTSAATVGSSQRCHPRTHAPPQNGTGCSITSPSRVRSSSTILYHHQKGSNFKSGHYPTRRQLEGSGGEHM
jgi:hypothetical protein